MEYKLELIRLKKAISNLEKAYVLLDYEHKNFIQSIIESYKKTIDIFEKKTLEVILPTNSEKCMVSSSFKKIILGLYFNPIEKKEKETFKQKLSFSDLYLQHDKSDGELNIDSRYSYNNYCECDFCKKESETYSSVIESFYQNLRSLQVKLNQACDNTILPQELIDSKILLIRRLPNHLVKNGTLEHELNCYIKIKMIECFNAQNQELIKQLTTQLINS